MSTDKDHAFQTAMVVSENLVRLTAALGEEYAATRNDLVAMQAEVARIAVQVLR